jgi:HEAT repeat protein
MRHRIFLVLGVWVLVGTTGSARGEEALADDEKALREAGIPTDGSGLLTFLCNRTIDASDADRLRKLVAQLGDDSFTVRELASRQLVGIGARARKVLTEALKDPDVEVSRRAQECLKQIEQGASATLVASAVRVLAQRRPAGTVEVLLNYLPSADDEMLAQEVRAVLADLALRDGKADPALVAALTDASALKRAAAGVALARARAAELLPAVRKLLADPDARVRLRVGLALSAARDKEALPVLIRLLDQLPAEETGLVEDLLFRLARDRSPPEVPGTDAASRRKYREAWEGWWKDHQAKIDLVELEKAGRTLGFTLVVLLDLRRVVDLDAANRPRWQIEGLGLPLDVQLLPGEQRVLIAEHDGNRVTERNLKGEVKWEHKIEAPPGGPAPAQRTHLHRHAHQPRRAGQGRQGGLQLQPARRRILHEGDEAPQRRHRLHHPDGGAALRASAAQGEGLGGGQELRRGRAHLGGPHRGAAQRQRPGA